MKAAIWSIRYWTEATDERMLDHELNKELENAGFTIKKQIEHQFEPYGYTALWLLGESHLAVHTFPEEKRSYIELSSCIKSKYDKFVKAIYKNPTIRPTKKKEDIATIITP